MIFNSQICTTREQSERLLSLGLKKETADMALIENWEYDLKDGKFFTGEYFERPIDYVEGMTGHYIPAWSLHRLLCLYGADYTIKEVYNNAEECYGMLICAIEIAIEDGDFNEEYLEKQWE